MSDGAWLKYFRFMYYANGTVGALLGITALYVDRVTGLVLFNVGCNLLVMFMIHAIYGRKI